MRAPRARQRGVHALRRRRSGGEGQTERHKERRRGIGGSTEESDRHRVQGLMLKTVLCPLICLQSHAPTKAHVGARKKVQMGKGAPWHRGRGRGGARV